MNVISKQLGNLISHKRIHAKDKPYQCDQCIYNISDPSNLTRHERVHTKEKPYKYDQCEI